VALWRADMDAGRMTSHVSNPGESSSRMTRLLPVSIK
jgi:hypothetical protein